MLLVTFLTRSIPGLNSHKQWSLAQKSTVSFTQKAFKMIRTGFLECDPNWKQHCKQFSGAKGDNLEGGLWPNLYVVSLLLIIVVQGFFFKIPILKVKKMSSELKVFIYSKPVCGEAVKASIPDMGPDNIETSNIWTVPERPVYLPHESL